MPEGQARVDSQGALCRTFEDEALAAERIFAARVAREGIRAAFLAVLAEDARVLGGEGPEPGRPAYEALPNDFPGLLQWEPAVVGAAPDGTLAFTTGPYRLLDPAGAEKTMGVYFSVWRRHPKGGHLELVLDFGAKGATFPEPGTGLNRLRTPGDPRVMERFLEQCLRTGRCPSREGALRLGDPAPGGTARPAGFHRSLDGGLGALWGARTRSDGTAGAFVLLFGAGITGPAVLACIHA